MFYLLFGSFCTIVSTACLVPPPNCFEPPSHESTPSDCHVLPTAKSCAVLPCLDLVIPASQASHDQSWAIEAMKR